MTPNEKWQPIEIGVEIPKEYRRVIEAAKRHYGIAQYNSRTHNALCMCVNCELWKSILGLPEGAALKDEMARDVRY